MYLPTQLLHALTSDDLKNPLFWPKVLSTLPTVGRKPIDTGVTVYWPRSRSNAKWSNRSHPDIREELL